MIGHALTLHCISRFLTHTHILFQCLLPAGMLVLVSKWCCFRQTASRQTHFHFSHLCFQNVVLISIASVMDPGLAPEVSWRFCNYWRTRTHTKNRHARPSWAQDLLQRCVSHGFATIDIQEHTQKTDTHVRRGPRTCSRGDLVMVLQLMTSKITYKKQTHTSIVGSRLAPQVS